jgi:hypothetical protein
VNNFLNGKLNVACETGLLSQNQIREILMDLDSDKEKYYAPEGTEK